MGHRVLVHMPSWGVPKHKLAPPPGPGLPLFSRPCGLTSLTRSKWKKNLASGINKAVGCWESGETGRWREQNHIMVLFYLPESFLQFAFYIFIYISAGAFFKQWLAISKTERVPSISSLPRNKKSTGVRQGQKTTTVTKYSCDLPWGCAG